MSPLRLGLALIRLYLKGYREVPGYTCRDREADGDIYIAMQLRKGTQ